jgi:transcriptional regulator with XRE-family HTH domain
MSEPDGVEAEEFFREFHGKPEYERERALLRPRTNLAINLLHLRKARGLTQAELAARAGMRQPRIAEIERGDYNARLDTVGKLAWALGVRAEDLVAEAVDGPAPAASPRRAGAARRFSR